MLAEIENVDILFNDAQFDANASNAQETFLIGGVGLGKTFFLALKLYEALLVRKSIHGLYAPSRKVLNESTYPQIKSAWQKIGFNENEHYVINRQPPLNWHVPKLSANHYKILTTVWGSYCIVDGLENFNSQRGKEFDEIFIDEFRDVKHEARTVLLGRLRGKAYKELGKQSRIWYATTPPDNPAYLKKLLQNKDESISFYFGGTIQNKKNLPDGYIEKLKSSYDDITFQREVMAELITYTDNRFLYAYDETRHLATLEANTKQILYLSFDFNVNPMTCLACQHYNNAIYILKEFRQENSNIFDFCKLIKHYTKDFGVINITGDASGNSRSAIARKGENYYTIIQHEIGRIRDSWVHVPRVNMEHSNSRVLCNSIFQRHPNLKIDSRCEYLIKDIENVLTDSEGKISKKDLDLTHHLDTLRYYLHTYHYKFLHTYRKLRNV